MNRYSQLTTLAAAFLATACADSTLEQESIYDRFGAEGKAYMSMAFNVPADPAETRAQTFENGTAAEYRVENATIVIFGSDVSDPTPEQLHYRTAVKLQWKNDGSDNTEHWQTPTPSDAETNPNTSYNTRITQWHSKVFQIDRSNIAEGERLFAYALVNEQPAYVAEDGSEIRFGETTDGEGNKSYAYTFTSGTSTFKQLMDMPMTNLKNGNLFVMTNAPMASVGSSNYDASKMKITYLPEIYASNIFPTEEEAAGKPATEINVERLAVKITLKGNETMKAGHLTTDENVHYDYSRIYFCPDQRNTSSYNVRHIGSDLSYLGYQADGKARRFLDNVATPPGLYRIFWGEDMNYDYRTTSMGKDGEGNQKTQETGGTTISDTTPIGLERGPNHTQYYFNDAKIDEDFYWHENTMNVNGLTQGRTTRMVIRIPFYFNDATKATSEADKDGSTGESYYTLSTESPDAIFLNDGCSVREYVKSGGNYVPEVTAKTTAASAEAKAGHTIAEKIYEYLDDMSLWQDWLQSIKDNASLSETTRNLQTKDLLSVTMFNGVQNQPGTLKNAPLYGHSQVLLSLNTASVAEADLDAVKAAFKAAFCSTAADYQGYKVVEDVTKDYSHYENDLDRELNGVVKFNFYEHGFAYYRVLVRHFGDDEVAPYVTTNGSPYDKVYPASKRAENYLGRYGMVRNTWYTITLQGVKHIGRSDDAPLPYDTPDDEVDNYLSVKVNVNKWAARNQDAIL